MANALTCWLARSLLGLCASRIKRGPDFVIGDPDDPYMLRWWVIPRNRLFNIYLHHVRRDDDDRALHDHPWWSLSLVLRGTVGELYRDRSGVDRERDLVEGAFVLRSANFLHRLYLPGGPAWTLFFTGPRIREWGFACDPETPAGGWRHWRDFTAPGSPGQPGPGCN